MLVDVGTLGTLTVPLGVAGHNLVAHFLAHGESKVLTFAPSLACENVQSHSQQQGHTATHDLAHGAAVVLLGAA